MSSAEPDADPGGQLSPQGSDDPVKHTIPELAQEREDVDDDYDDDSGDDHKGVVYDGDGKAFDAKHGNKYDNTLAVENVATQSKEEENEKKEGNDLWANAGDWGNSTNDANNKEKNDKDNTKEGANEDANEDGDQDVQELDKEAELEIQLEKDFKDGAATGTVYLQDIFASYRTIFELNGEQFSKDMIPNNDPAPSCTLSFRTPERQRNVLVLRVNVPRLQEPGANPDQHTSYSTWVYMPASRITNMDLTNPASESDTNNFEKGAGFTNSWGQPNLVALVTVEASQVIVASGPVPELATPELTKAVEDLVNTARSASVNFKFLIRTAEDGTLTGYDRFLARKDDEMMRDPARNWIQNSPNALVLTMGTVVPLWRRPNIPAQRAETVFLDKLGYLIPHVYGAVFEEEYQKAIYDEFCATELKMALVECATAMHVEPPSPNTAGDPHIQSSACAYFAFVDFTGTDLVRPSSGTKIKVTLMIGNQSTSAAPSPPDPVKPSGDTDADEDTTNPNQELGNEEGVNMWDADGRELNSDRENVWMATVMDPTEITPPGHLTLFLQRRRALNWRGPQSDRPWVSLKLTAVNSRVAGSYEELMGLVVAGPKINVFLEEVYSNQGLKDQIRCSNELWTSTNNQQRRIRQSLLCHTPDDLGLARTDLHALRKQYRFTETLNASQLEFYKSLHDTPEITVLHGPYGTGKTHTVVSITAEVAAVAPNEEKQQVLFAVEHNLAADEVALRYDKLYKDNGLEVNVCRLHSLPGEKSGVYSEYGSGPPPPDFFDPDIPTPLEAAYELTHYLHLLDRRTKRSIRHGDPRRVLHELSLTAAMHKVITSSEDEGVKALNTMLDEYARDGFYLTPLDTRMKIKDGLNKILAQTLRQQDVIVCTTATAAKVNLITNFRPKIVVLDEAARTSELKSLAVFAGYNPKAFILVGDHLQQPPHCQSYGREKDKTSPYLNPFASQMLLSYFERMIRAGVPHHQLTLQHRCHGEISAWVSQEFYRGLVKEAPPTNSDDEIVRDMRKFVQRDLGAKVTTNRFVRNIQGSKSQKEEGGSSSINEDEIKWIMRDLDRMLKDSLFSKLSIGVMAFYKAQAVRLKQEIDKLKLPVAVVDVSSLTVGSSQGTQYDVVLLSLVTTHSTEFINEPHALVVGLTRAKYLLGVYSNYVLVDDNPKENGKNRYILRLLKDLRDCNHIIDCVADVLNKPCFNCGKPGHQKNACTNEKADRCARCQENNDMEKCWDHTASNCTHYEQTPMCFRCKKAKRPNYKEHVNAECPHFEEDESTVKCRECNNIGHKRSSCPQVRCKVCKEMGHTQSKCTMPMQCTKCNQIGHFSRSCNVVRSRAYIAQVRGIPGRDDIERVDPAETSEDQENTNTGEMTGAVVDASNSNIAAAPSVNGQAGNGGGDNHNGNGGAGTWGGESKGNPGENW